MKTKKHMQKVRITIRDRRREVTNNYRKLHGLSVRRGSVNKKYKKDIEKVYIAINCLDVMNKICNKIRAARSGINVMSNTLANLFRFRG